MEKKMSRKFVVVFVLSYVVLFLGRQIEGKRMSSKDSMLRSGSLEQTLEELNNKVGSLQNEMKDLETEEDPEQAAKKEIPAVPEDTDRYGDESKCKYDTCDECNANTECGWCPLLSQCFEGDSLGPYSSNCTTWLYEVCPSGCRDHYDCESCVGDKSCGFCYSSCTCMDGTHAGGPDVGSCSGGWYHESGRKQCPPVERMPGDGTQTMDEMLCSDTIYRRTKMREAIEKVDRANSWRVKSSLEEGDRDLW